MFSFVFYYYRRFFFSFYYCRSFCFWRDATSLCPGDDDDGYDDNGYHIIARRTCSRAVDRYRADGRTRTRVAVARPWAARGCESGRTGGYAPSKSFTRVFQSEKKKPNESQKKTLLFPPRTDCRQRVLNTGRTLHTHTHTRNRDKITHRTIGRDDCVYVYTITTTTTTTTMMMMIDERRRKSSERAYIPTRIISIYISEDGGEKNKKNVNVLQSEIRRARRKRR